MSSNLYLKLVEGNFLKDVSAKVYDLLLNYGVLTEKIILKMLKINKEDLDSALSELIKLKLVSELEDGRYISLPPTYISTNMLEKYHRSIRNKQTTLVSNINRQLSEFDKEVEEVLVPLLRLPDSIKKTVNKTIRGLENSLKSKFEEMYSFKSEIIEMLNVLLTELDSFWNNVLHIIDQYKETIEENTLNRATEFKDRIILRINDYLKSEADEIKNIEKIIDDYKKKIEGIINDLKKSSSKKLDELSTNINKELEVLSNSISSISSDMKPMISNLKQEFQDTIEKLAQELVSELKNRTENNMISLSNLFEKINEKITGIMNEIKNQISSDISELEIELHNNTKSLSNNLEKSIITSVENAEKILKRDLESIVMTSEDIFSKIDLTLKNLEKTIPEALDSMIINISHLFASAIKMIETRKDFIKNAITGHNEEIANIISGNISLLNQDFGRDLDTIYDKILNFRLELITTIRNNLNKAMNRFAKIGDGIEKIIDKKRKELTEGLGKDLEKINEELKSNFELYSEKLAEINSLLNDAVVSELSKTLLDEIERIKSKLANIKEDEKKHTSKIKEIFGIFNELLESKGVTIDQELSKKLESLQKSLLNSTKNSIKRYHEVIKSSIKNLDLIHKNVIRNYEIVIKRNLDEAKGLFDRVTRIFDKYLQQKIENMIATFNRSLVEIKESYVAESSWFNMELDKINSATDQISKMKVSYLRDTIENIRSTFVEKTRELNSHIIESIEELTTQNLEKIDNIISRSISSIITYQEDMTGLIRVSKQNIIDSLNSELGSIEATIKKQSMTLKESHEKIILNMQNLIQAAKEIFSDFEQKTKEFIDKSFKDFTTDVSKEYEKVSAFITETHNEIQTMAKKDLETSLNELEEKIVKLSSEKSDLIDSQISLMIKKFDAVLDQALEPLSSISSAIIEQIKEFNSELTEGISAFSEANILMYGNLRQGLDTIISGQPSFKENIAEESNEFEKEITEACNKAETIFGTQKETMSQRVAEMTRNIKNIDEKIADVDKNLRMYSNVILEDLDNIVKRISDELEAKRREIDKNVHEANQLIHNSMKKIEETLLNMLNEHHKQLEIIIENKRKLDDSFIDHLTSKKHEIILSKGKDALISYLEDLVQNADSCVIITPELTSEMIDALKKSSAFMEIITIDKRKKLGLENARIIHAKREFQVICAISDKNIAILSVPTKEGHYLVLQSSLEALIEMIKNNLAAGILHKNR
ncbi:MAG: hypothetical protein Q6351_010125 [Candidatus Njordarchaeum guaymaensis]